jgi:excisionase family DNA binding protein
MDSTASLPGHLTLPDFSQRFRVSRNTIYRELAAGRLHAVKAGTRTLIPLAEAERWAASLPTYQPKAAA